MKIDATEKLAQTGNGAAIAALASFYAKGKRVTHDPLKATTFAYKSIFVHNRYAAGFKALADTAYINAENANPKTGENIKKAVNATIKMSDKYPKGAAIAMLDLCSNEHDKGVIKKITDIQNSSLDKDTAIADFMEKHIKEANKLSR